MDSKIKILIDKLNLTDNCKKEFEGSKLVKIVGSKDKTNYCFYISLNTKMNL